MVSKNLENPIEKHFKRISLYSSNDYTKEESTLNDDSFADITFDKFRGSHIKKLVTKHLVNCKVKQSKNFGVEIVPLKISCQIIIFGQH